MKHSSERWIELLASGLKNRRPLNLATGHQWYVFLKEHIIMHDEFDDHENQCIESNNNFEP